MTTQFVNYVLMGIGILTVLGAAILIFLDKLKGDDMYFNIDVKAQEMKKVIEDAEEILSELNFTSDVIVKEIEEKINSLNRIYKSVNHNLSQMQASRPVVVEPQQAPVVEKTVITPRFKPVTVSNAYKEVSKQEKPKTKHQQILDYAEQGMDIVEIAKRMNIGQGEVALILSLKNEES